MIVNLLFICTLFDVSVILFDMSVILFDMSMILFDMSVILFDMSVILLWNVRYICMKMYDDRFIIKNSGNVVKKCMISFVMK